jgi:hypothetical protein
MRKHFRQEGIEIRRLLDEFEPFVKLEQILNQPVGGEARDDALSHDGGISQEPDDTELDVPAKPHFALAGGGKPVTRERVMRMTAGEESDKNIDISQT